MQHQVRTDKLDEKEEVEEQSEEQNIIYEKIERKFRRTETEEQEKLASMKGGESKKLRDITEEINSIIKRIATNTIGETNRLIYAGARVIRAKLGIKSERNTHRTEPGWKTRLEKKLKERRQDLSRLDKISWGRYVTSIS